MLNKSFTRGSLWMCLLAVALSLPTNSTAQLYSAPVKLGWNPPNDPNVKGYVIYYGLTNQPATNRMVVGTNLTVTVTNMLAARSYNLYAVSYNAFNVESLPSNALLITPPAISGIKVQQQANRSMKLDVRAAAGAVCCVQFSPNMKAGTWRMLTNITANSLGAIILADATAGLVPQRFYRVALGAQPLLSAIEIGLRLDGKVELHFTAPPMASCRIEYAPKSQPSNWSLLANVAADADGSVTYVDTVAKTITSRFYRVVMQ
jgi:hypothetical protein